MTRVGGIGFILFLILACAGASASCRLRRPDITPTRMLEPLILSVLGLIVGVMTLSMFLPLFDLAAAGGTSGGGQ